MIWFPFRIIVNTLNAIAAQLAALDTFLREQFQQGPPGPDDSPAALGLRLSIVDKPGTRKGAIMSLALAFNDREFAEGTLVPSAVDVDGQPFVNPDGTPADISAIGIGYTSDNPAVVDASESIGQSFKFKSGTTGIAKVTVTIGPYPNGANVNFEFDCIVGNSAPGDPTVAVEIKPEP